MGLRDGEALGIIKIQPEGNTIRMHDNKGSRANARSRYQEAKPRNRLTNGWER